MVRFGPLSGQKTSEPKNSKRARDRPLPVGWGMETKSKRFILMKLYPKNVHQTKDPSIQLNLSSKKSKHLLQMAFGPNGTSIAFKYGVGDKFGG